MRVTENMMFSKLMGSVARAQSRYLTAQERAQTGQRVQRLSDDPVVGARGVVLSARLRGLENMERAAERVRYELSTAEAALAEADTSLARARALAVQGSNASLTATDRQALAAEIDSIRDGLLAIANTDAAGVYVFGGYKTTASPFQADGTYVGDTGVRSVEVAPGVRIDANVSGATVFGASGGTDVFGVLASLRDDLAANNASGAQSRIDELETAIGQITTARSTHGTALARLDEAEGLRENTMQVLQSARAQAVEVDPAEAFGEFVQAQNALQAVLTQASSILSRLSGQR